MSSQSPARRPTLAFTWDDFGRLAARIKQLRAERGWTHRELSRRAEIAPDRLSRLERGSPIRGDELAALSGAFGLSLDELVLAPPRGGAPDQLDQLARQVRAAVPAEDLPALLRLARALVEGLRARRGAEPKGDDE